MIGRRLNVSVVSKSTDHFGFLKPFVSINSPASSKLTQENLGWRPAQPSLFTDLERGITLISREKPEFDIKKVSKPGSNFVLWMWVRRSAIAKVSSGKKCDSCSESKSSIVRFNEGFLS